jgi:hypothetical protein
MARGFAQFALCGYIVAVLPGTAFAAGPSDGLNVKITNTPVPVQGTVSVSNLPAATRPVSLRAPLSSDGACAPFLGGQSLNFTLITNPDGTEQPFTIPAGSTLVITAVEILGFATTPGQNIQTRLFRGVVGSGLNLFSIRESTANAAGRIFHQYEFPSGVEVASGGLVCTNANDNNMGMSGFLYGFLK